mmetsp:Transcript_26816/g.66071  ORF Transcript_26816/g.66071 Transcript_26816/m.66071 type:complete len:401 (+) Transcript_26816:212-1414(+)
MKPKRVKNDTTSNHKRYTIVHVLIRERLRSSASHTHDTNTILLKPGGAPISARLAASTPTALRSHRLRGWRGARGAHDPVLLLHLHKRKLSVQPLVRVRIPHVPVCARHGSDPAHARVELGAELKVRHCNTRDEAQLHVRWALGDLSERAARQVELVLPRRLHPRLLDNPPRPAHGDGEGLGDVGDVSARDEHAHHEVRVLLPVAHSVAQRRAHVLVLRHVRGQDVALQHAHEARPLAVAETPQQVDTLACHERLGRHHVVVLEGRGAIRGRELGLSRDEERVVDARVVHVVQQRRDEEGETFHVAQPLKHPADHRQRVGSLRHVHHVGPRVVRVVGHRCTHAHDQPLEALNGHAEALRKVKRLEELQGDEEERVRVQRQHVELRALEPPTDLLELLPRL